MTGSSPSFSEFKTAEEEKMSVHIVPYSGNCNDRIIALILGIQNK